MSRVWSSLAVWVILAAGLLAAGPGSAPAAMPGEWQAKPSFQIDFEDFPGGTAGGTRAVYSLLDPQGQIVEEAIETTVLDPIELVDVPPIPGVYTLEGQLEDAAGQELRRACIPLRFDDTPPPPPALQAARPWLLGSEPVVLKLDPPVGPLPPSGIRAYEVTLDQGTRFEASGDSISLGFLPEGINHGELVALSGAGVRSEASAVTFAVDATPPAVSLEGLPAGWSDRPVKLTAFARDPLSGMEPAGGSGPYTAIAVDGGAPVLTPGTTASTWVSGSGVHSVRVYGRDAAGNVGDPGPGSPSNVPVRIDELGPRVAFAVAQDPADPERIEAFVSDALSGPSHDRGSIAVRPAGTRARFEPLPTRVEAGRLVARWDSDAYPDGRYEFLAIGYDGAGNSTAATKRQHGAAMVLLNPLKAQTSLTTKLASGRLIGTLRRAPGRPVAGETIRVLESFATGADRRQRTTYVPTGADGSFSLRLQPGPSREVVASFAGNRTLSRASGPTAHLLAATMIRFRTSAASAAIGGKPVVFSGKVGARGAQAAITGLPVELQFRYPGAEWSEFRTVEADARGRFRYAYRFSDDDSRGVRFQFRAYVKGREGWPYGPGASRPLSVEGR